VVNNRRAANAIQRDAALAQQIPENLIASSISLIAQPHLYLYVRHIVRVN
jgi:hypothetical protein